MKTLTFDKKSWHYELAEMGGFRYYDWQEQNFCTYARKVLIGIFLSILITIIGAGAAGTVVMPLVTYIGYLSTGVWLGGESGDIHVAYFIVDTVLIVTVLLWYLVDVLIPCAYNGAIEFVTKEVRKVPSDSFVKTWWKSFKEKTCFKIEFIDGEK